MAIRWGRTDTAKLLITANAFLDTEDNNGSTPIHLAIKWGRTGILRNILYNAQFVK
ncbi:unnamed protein product, partial [marine sediment metagenome]